METSINNVFIAIALVNFFLQTSVPPKLHKWFVKWAWLVDSLFCLAQIIFDITTSHYIMAIIWFVLLVFVLCVQFFYREKR